MKARPDGLSDRDVEAALATGWNINARVEYLPVGAGSYHWRAAALALFVTVDDLDHKPFLGDGPDDVFEALRRALETTVALRRGGLEFVVAPIEGRDGAVLWRITRRYAVAVYPYLGEPRPFKKTLTGDERAAFRVMLARLHATSVGKLARVVRPEVPLRRELEMALDAPPLAANAPLIRGWLDRLDQLVRYLDASDVPLVVTHGEPHSGNIVRTAGGFVLVDWDTVGLAPRERDLWLVGGGDLQLCELYRLRWRLDDLSWAVSMLHDDPDVALTALRASIDHEPFTRD